MKTSDPRSRTGIYNTYQEVPPHHRLEQKVNKYSDQNIWEHFVEERGVADRAYPAMNRFQRVMEGRGVHYAFPHPTDVDAYCDHLIDFAVTTIRSHYTYLNYFFEWLRYHTEYPHRYNPLLVAAVEYENSARVFQYYVEKGEKTNE